MACSSVPIHCSFHPLYPVASPFGRRSLTIPWPGFGNKPNVDSLMYVGRWQRFQALVNATKGAQNDDVVMVDPLEAKRLAAIQMQEIRAKEKFKRRRRIEAINGAWAMIGLTVGVVIEGHTGNGVLAQLAGYWRSFIGFFFR